MLVTKVGKLVVGVAILLTLVGFLKYFQTRAEKINMLINLPTPSPSGLALDALSVELMRQRDYPGSDLKIEQVLSNGSNYKQYIASYQSEGLTIYALLTVPLGQKPQGGWPVIVFNHGYIPPTQYKTTERYVAYVDAFAKAGYIVIKPDYRGHGSSRGLPEGAYYSPAYTIDDLNAIASIKKYPDADPNKVGIWGHSMGGNITLRDLVVEPGWVKAAVIWGGVVGSYQDLEHWHDPAYHPSQEELALRYKHRSELQQMYGTPEQDPVFWNSIDPTHFLSDISVPIQLDVGGSDQEVPVQFSTSLKDRLESAGKSVEYIEYPGADHNISQSLTDALGNSVDFFNKYLK